MQQSRSILKEYFKTKKIPTEAQFAELIDSVPNIVEDGCVRSKNNGLILSPKGGNNTLLEIYSEELETDFAYTVKEPCWSLVLDDDKNIQLLDAEGTVVFSSATKKQSDLQGKKLKIPADKRWHTLQIDDSEIGQRMSARAYRIVGFYKHPHTKHYKFTEVNISHCNGRKLTMESPSKQWGIWFSKILFRWVIVNREICLQARSRRKKSQGNELMFHVSKLWECVD